ncbi:coenzyme F420:L-glutamate ligase [Halomonas elongata]|uniref:Coenzyme F420:L-glutamate ligase n=1 Tax=Halomonas elongata TaxID=2746 RepID=A0A1B8P779_HALEL|nr:coenzyme F420-0:L-glutamate ligase [Halomonas elongata]OBX38146.1 coenzyme F420:L-glutamate ligase [Halomonas elongata]
MSAPKKPSSCCPGSRCQRRPRLEAAFGVRLGIVVTDTFGRPWRMGLVNVAIGLARVPARIDMVGERDAFGRVLSVTMPALADDWLPPRAW